MEDNIIKERASFLQELVELLRKKLGKKVEIRLTDIIKTNDVKIPSIAIRRSEDPLLSRGYHGDELFEYHRKGMPLEEVAEKLIELMEKDKSMPVDGKMMNDIIHCYSYMREGNLMIKLVNLEANKEYLEDMCFIPYLDLAITFHALISREKDRIATLPITNSIFEAWGITKEELLADVSETMQIPFPVHVKTMRSMMEKLIEEMKQEDFAEKMNPPEIEAEKILPKEEEMLIVTNKTGIHGAASILYPGFLKVTAETLGVSGMYLLPSSVHEFIMVPCDGRAEEKELVNIIREINRLCVTAEEKLSDHLYIYDAETDKVRIWDGE